jgi:tRNA pseudouridine38-40 synthase
MAWRARLLVEYDGTDYAGWQRQPNLATVQGDIEAALAVVFKRAVRVVGAGRTDAGVHALGQVAHADLPASAADYPALCDSLNALTPAAIAIRGVTSVPPGFDARRSARRRIYRYRLTPRRIACERQYVWQVKWPVSLAKLRRCARALPGDRFFTSFCVAKSAAKGTRCCVHRARWLSVEGEYRFEVEADRFVHGMVRSLVGTMVEVAAGKMPMTEFEQLLVTQRRQAAGPTAPAHGLCLLRVDYADS